MEPSSEDFVPRVGGELKTLPTPFLLTTRNVLLAAGVVLLLAFAALWAWSLHDNRLHGVRHTWMPVVPHLGWDFLCNYQATRAWHAGINPYREPYGDPQGVEYCYPPLVMYLFAWCRLVSPRQAVLIWTAVVVALGSLGVVAAWRTRRRLGLWDVPLPFLLAALLCSWPMTFELERGNCDVLVLLLLVAAAAVLRRPAAWLDVAAGAALALATWIKIYPGLLVLGLLALRRGRAVAGFAVAFVALGVADLPGTRLYVETVRGYVGRYDVGFHVAAHTLTTHWRHYWQHTRYEALAHIPGALAAGAILLPLALAVSWRVFRCGRPRDVLYPYFLWLTALATFLPPVANDYNLIFLLLAALAVWDRRDPVWVHCLMAAFLFVWQPVAVSIGPMLFFSFKLGGLGAVGVSLLGRIREQGQAAAVAAPEDAVSVPLAA
jgi:Glycosyltransferase family 87